MWRVPSSTRRRRCQTAIGRPEKRTVQLRSPGFSGSQEGPSTGAPSTSPGLLVSDTARCLASGNGTSVLKVELLMLEMAFRRRSQPPSKPVRFSSCAVGFGWKRRPHPSSGCGISTAKRYIHLWTNASNRAEASTPSTNSGGLPNIRQHILTTPSGDPYLSG